MLRPEARPLAWGALDKAQKEATYQILALLREAVSELPSEKQRRDVQGERDGGFQLDDDRSSRILLLSGERGTGKTTVLLSIKRLTEGHRGSPADEKKEEKKEEKKPTWEDVEKVLGKLSQRLVWLEPIDMEPLAEPTNLLAAILARVSEAARGRSGEESDFAGLLESRPEYHDTLLRLQRLETNVALAWDGNLAARGGQLDPDNFAVEVMRTERARLSLNRSLKEALDGVAWKVFGKGGRDGVSNPLFVLPVDDFDLNPLRCLDLLRVLRMLSVPRLLTLVLGDVSVAEMLFNLKLSGDFSRLAGRSGREELLSLSAEYVRSMAGEVAANAIRKLIPPAQIVHLEYMDLAEALKYAPAPDEPALHCVLAASPLRYDARYQLAYRMANLAEFFRVEPPIKDLPGPTGESSELPDQAEPWDAIGWSDYTGIWVFRNSPRRIADLWHELKLHVTEETQARLTAKGDLLREPAPSYNHIRTLVSVFANHCRRSIAEDLRLPDRGRRILLDAIRKNREGYWGLDTSTYKVKAKTGKAYSFGLPPGPDLVLRQAPAGDKKARKADRSVLKAPYQRVVAYRTNGWSVQVPPDSSKKAPLEMEYSTAAALIVFHDLVVLSNLGTQGAGIWEEMVRRRTLEWDSPVTEWRSEGRRVRIKWPCANWSSFREYDFFISAWLRVIKWLDQEPPPLVEPLRRFEALAFAWMDLNLTALDPWEAPPAKSILGTTPRWVCLPWPAGFHDVNLKLTPNWPKLIKNLGAFVQEYYPLINESTKQRVQKSHPSMYRALDWLTQLAVFLMPETLGTSLHQIIDEYFPDEPVENPALERGANEVRDLKALYELWQSSAEDIRNHRARKFAYLRSRVAENCADYLQSLEPPACLRGKEYKPTEELIRYFQEEIRRAEKASKRQAKTFPNAARDAESAGS